MSGDGGEHHRAKHETDQERQPPARVACPALKHVAEDATDAGDAPVQEQQNGRGQPDQQAPTRDGRWLSIDLLIHRVVAVVDWEALPSLDLGPNWRE